jgi:hypothetical protein
MVRFTMKSSHAQEELMACAMRDGAGTESLSQKNAQPTHAQEPLLSLLPIDD